MKGCSDVVIFPFLGQNLGQTLPKFWTSWSQVLSSDLRRFHTPSVPQHSRFSTRTFSLIQVIERRLDLLGLKGTFLISDRATLLIKIISSFEDSEELVKLPPALKAVLNSNLTAELKMQNLNLNCHL